MGYARNGQNLLRDGEIVASRSAAVVRAELLRAHRHDDDTIEAEAGAILEAETAVEIHGLYTMVKAYMERQ